MSTTDPLHTKLIGNYTIGKEIGRGSFATVYCAQNVNTQNIVACKAVQLGKLTKKLLDNLEAEIAILKTIKHPHIVELLDCHKAEHDIYLMMEYCEMGDLSGLIKRRAELGLQGPAGGLEEKLARHFLQHLASALYFLRSRQLVHRDIKPQNLLLVAGTNKSDYPTLKLADFGFARYLDAQSLADTLCGSPLYMAPEILSYKKYDAKADLWSTGAVLYECVMGKPPFRAQNHLELLKKIEKSGDVIRFSSDDSVLSAEFKQLIRSLLKKDPVERLSFEAFFRNSLVVGSFLPPPAPISPPSTVGIGLSPVRIPRRSDPGIRTQQSETPSSQNVSPEWPSTSVAAAAAPWRTQRPSNTSVVDRASSVPTRHSPTTMERTLSSRALRRLSSGLATINLYNDAENIVALPAETVPNVKPVSLRSRAFKPKEATSTESEYVIVEKRTVEVNSLADEVNNSTNPKPPPHLPQPLPPITPNHPTTRAGEINNNSPTTAMVPYSSSPDSAKSSRRGMSAALTKMYSASPPSWGLFRLLSAKKRSSVDLQVTESVDPEEDKVVQSIENLTSYAYAVCKIADSKLRYVLSHSTSNENVSGVYQEVTRMDPQSERRNLEEIVLLYLKTLSLLQAGMTVAKNWWEGHVKPKEKHVSPRFSEIVQVVRDRYNEILEKADFGQSRLSAFSNVNLQGSSLSVEKLLYDQALETSRAAAVAELNGEDAMGCEASYKIAIWMLKAILEPAGGESLNIPEQDRLVVEQLVEVISQRLQSFRRRIQQEQQQQQQQPKNQ